MKNKYSSTLLGVALGLGLGMIASANAAVLQVRLWVSRDCEIVTCSDYGCLEIVTGQDFDEKNTL